MLAACGKKPQPSIDPCAGVKPPDGNLSTTGFIVRQHSAASVSNILKANSLIVTQACNGQVVETEHVENEGTIRFNISATSACNTLYLKWNAIDVDTLTYRTLVSTGLCYCTYSIDTSSLMLNGERVHRDIINPDVYAFIK
ncbi:MAG: hypothetical protein EOP56_17835 [Sphingobacteriales bacterium]|nr:MAG: hypothetical protein EOP56_17835 [Sphingobacteriales bacterium]